jgi:hypothetical protein
MTSLFVPSGDLKRDIARLSGQEEAQSLPRPILPLGGQHFVRIRGIIRVENENERCPRAADGGANAGASAVGELLNLSPSPRLTRITEDLICGFYALRLPWAFLILGEEQEISVFWGLASAHDHVGNFLRGSFPGIQLEQSDPASLVDRLYKLPWGALMTGIPSPKEEGLERLIRGLYGSPWAYLVLAKPLEPQAISLTFEALAEEARRVKNTYLRKTSVEEDNHPLARYYLELLEAALGKYKQARVQGAWEARVALLAAHQATLEQGMALLASAFSGERSLPRPIRVQRCLPTPTEGSLFPPTVLNTVDLALLVRLPQEEMPGYQVFDGARFAVALPHERKKTNPVAIGKVLDRSQPTGQWLELEAADFVKHSFITGVTGSGKTESCFFLLDQLWREQGVPFLVLEPAKREYRALRNYPGFECLRVFTLGDESGREPPFRMNPFEVPEGIHVQTHIDLLRSLFNASFAGLYAPMPYLLEEALYAIYAERGWDLTRGECGGHRLPSERFPTLSDLCAKVEEVVEQAGYDPEVTQNVQTALRVRLNSLRIGAKGLMLDTTCSTSMEELLGSPTVLELAALGDPEVVAFLMGLLWLRLYEHRFAQGPNPLKHVTILEEAHRLMARHIQFSGHPEVSNVRAQAVEVFCNMLAELRAFGEALLIVDQSPTKLHPDVLKNTNLKMVHRLVVQEDREAIGGCTNMRGAQIRALATLATGQAVAYAEGMKEPFLVQVPLFRAHSIKPTEEPYGTGV